MPCNEEKEPGKYANEMAEVAGRRMRLIGATSLLLFVAAGGVGAVAAASSQNTPGNDPPAAKQGK